MTKRANITNPKPFFLLFLGGILVTLSSFIRGGVTHSIKVDGNYLSGLPMAVNLVVLLLGFGLFFFTYVNVVLRKENYDLSLSDTRWAAIMLVLVATPMLPMLSNDLYSLLAYGDQTLLGMNPYTDGKSMDQSVFFSYVSDQYKFGLCPYGPLNVLLAALAVLLAGKSIGLSIIFMKLIFLGIGILFIEFSYKLVVEFRLSGLNTLALVILCPVFWIQGIGQNHTDMLGSVFLVLALWWLVHDKLIFAMIAIGLAIASKLSFAFLLPMPILYGWLKENKGWGALAKYSVLSGACTTLVLLALYGYFIAGTGWTPLDTVGLVANARPSGTFSDMLGEIASIVYPMISDSGLSTDEIRTNTWSIIVPFFKIIGILLALWVAKNIFAIKDLKDVFFLFGIIGAIILTIYTQKFFNWYLLLITPLFLLIENKFWIKWLVFLGPTAVAMDFMHIPIRESALFPVLVVVPAFACCCLFLWKFKERYLRPQF